MNPASNLTKYKMTFQHGHSEGLLVAPLGPNLYRLGELGGNWERIFGGILSCTYHRAEHDAIVGELNILVSQFHGTSSDR